MKWQGRQGSDNVEDRRGMSRGKMAIGGGIGTIVIVFLVMLLGGDPSSLINDMGTGTNESGTYQGTAEEEELAGFVKVVLKDTEDVWSKIFAQSGYTYRMPTLVLFSGQVQSACGYASASSGPFYCPGDTFNASI